MCVAGYSIKFSFKTDRLHESIGTQQCLSFQPQVATNTSKRQATWTSNVRSRPILRETSVADSILATAPTRWHQYGGRHIETTIDKVPCSGFDIVHIILFICILYHMCIGHHHVAFSIVYIRLPFMQSLGYSLPGGVYHCCYSHLANVCT